MTTVRIPLVGNFNQRGITGIGVLNASEDQRFKNCTFDVLKNPVTGKLTVYVQKRPGWFLDSTPGGSNASTGIIKPLSFNATITAFSDTNSTIYYNTTSVGTITGRAMHFTETLNGTLGCVVFRSSDGTGWYYVDGAKDQLTYTGDTHTNTVIDNIASTSGMYVGQKLSGTNIVAGTRIAGITSGTAITIDTATTGTTAGVTITKEPIAKIIDTDFVTAGSTFPAFVEMDGYLFYGTDTGKVYNSDLNSVTSYDPTNFISPNMSPDNLVALARHKNTIIAMGGASKEVYFNAGNATGSPLQRAPQYFDRVGCFDQRAVTTLENDIYFASSPRYGDMGIFRIRDLQTEKVSTAAVDTILGTTTASGGVIYASSFRLGGYAYVQFVVSGATDGPTSKLLMETGDFLLLESGDKILLEEAPSQVASYRTTLIYNADLGIWSEWDSSVSTFVTGGSSTATNAIYATSRFGTAGAIYRIKPSSDGQLNTDNGTAFTMEIRLSKIDHGTSKRKRIHSLRLICDKDTTGTASISWSDDDYATWSTPRTIDLSSKEPKLTNLGSHKGYRAYKITQSSNTPFRAEAIEIEYSSEDAKVATRPTQSSNND